MVNDKTEKVYKYLLSCGFRPQLLGFKYLIEAINIYIKTDKLVTFEKDIYLKLAKDYGKKSASVKKAIKNAIDGAALKYDLSDENSIFSDESYSKSGSIKASEFIAYSANKIKTFL